MIYSLTRSETFCGRKATSASLRLALGIILDQLPVKTIIRYQFQLLTDTQTVSGNQYEHQPVFWIPGPENDLINHVFFQNIELSWFEGCGNVLTPNSHIRYC
jgi:hypothetical protein